MTQSLRQRFSTPDRQPRLRVIAATIGPGKAELLHLVDETGSISQAARRMRMSYLRAWKLIESMNRAFRKPLVASGPGGPRGGGSTLTATGRRVVALYDRLHARSLAAVRRDLAALHRLLRT